MITLRKLNQVVVLFLSLVLMVGGASAAFAALPPKDQAAGQSLYMRLGGYDALAAVSDDFIGRLATDPSLAKFFVGLNDESKKKVRQHVIDFLCVHTGGPCYYLGRDMKTAHTGLHITKAEWNASAAHLVETLNKFKVPEKEQSEVMTMVSSLKGDIVGQ
jgi:hemoglobin